MEYDEFFAQYKRAHDEWSFGKLDAAGASAALARLQELVPSVEPSDKQQFADYLLRQWANETSVQADDRMARAMAVLARASADEGTLAERLARAEAGIAEITGIANETTDVAERYAILGLNETLATTIDTAERPGRPGRP
ncbi:hypothetical protein [Kribbella sp. NPDC023855]|uniref:hypothetical protein n=1 Tax=Kribbella sp. NPDC023855 TaxID=3154698 RepID=UPI0033C8DD67